MPKAHSSKTSKVSKTSELTKTPKVGSETPKLRTTTTVSEKSMGPENLSVSLETKNKGKWQKMVVRH